MQKKNRIILELKLFPKKNNIMRSCLNGKLIQSSDNITDDREILSYPTKLNPDDKQIDDLLFASKICKNTKSNTIVLVKNKQLEFINGGWCMNDEADTYYEVNE